MFIVPQQTLRTLKAKLEMLHLQPLRLDKNAPIPQILKIFYLTPTVRENYHLPHME